MTKEEIEVKMDEEVEEIDVKEFIKQFKKDHPVKFWMIVTAAVLTGTAAIGGIAYVLYRKFGPKNTDEEEEASEDWYEDKTEESESEEHE